MYSRYLKSNHWKETREAKLTNVDHCQICDSNDNLVVHHKRYKIENKEAENAHKRIGRKLIAGSILYREENKDLMVLCRSCHSLWHSYFGRRYLTHKKASQIRRLLRYGIVKDKAFMVTKNNILYTPVLNKAMGIYV